MQQYIINDKLSLTITLNRHVPLLQQSVALISHSSRVSSHSHHSTPTITIRRTLVGANSGIQRRLVGMESSSCSQTNRAVLDNTGDGCFGVIFFLHLCSQTLISVPETAKLHFFSLIALHAKSLLDPFLLCSYVVNSAEMFPI